MSTNVMKLLFLAMALACVAATPDSSESELSDVMKNTEMNEEELPLFVSMLFSKYNAVENRLAACQIWTARSQLLIEGHFSESYAWAC